MNRTQIWTCLRFYLQMELSNVICFLVCVLNLPVCRSAAASAISFRPRFHTKSALRCSLDQVNGDPRNLEMFTLETMENGTIRTSFNSDRKVDQFQDFFSSDVVNSQVIARNQCASGWLDFIDFDITRWILGSNAIPSASLRREFSSHKEVKELLLNSERDHCIIKVCRKEIAT